MKGSSGIQLEAAANVRFSSATTTSNDTTMATHGAYLSSSPKGNEPRQGTEEEEVKLSTLIGKSSKSAEEYQKEYEMTTLAMMVDNSAAEIQVLKLKLRKWQLFSLIEGIMIIALTIVTVLVVSDTL